MSFFTRLFGTERARTEKPIEMSESERISACKLLLDKAESLIFDLWRKQGSLVRQAVFRDAAGKVSMAAFPSASSREVSLRELKTAAAGKRPLRVFFFSESGAVGPDGQSVDVILSEVGDARLAYYGQRIYSAAPEPTRLAENAGPLDESPLAGVLIGL